MKIDSKAEIVFEESTYDNNQITNMCMDLCDALTERGVLAGDTVTVAMPRNVYSMISMFTLYLMNVTYVLADITLPKSRIEYMLENSNTVLIIGDDSTEDAFPGFKMINVNKLEHRESRGYEFDDCFSRFKRNEDGIMYISYTSGTTGKPKGVMVTRSGFENFADAFIKSNAYQTGGTIACLTNFSFDIIHCETIIPLMLGMKIVLANENEKDNVKKRCELIVKNNVEYIQCTPSAMMMMKLYDEKLSFLDNVNTLILGGEACPEALLQKLSAKKQMRIMNYYGPTETTVWSTYSDLTGKEHVDIGVPLSNTEIYILSDELTEVNVGETGEICIGGTSLARGYCQNQEATDKAFVTYNGKRVYKTGDLGYTADGVIYCCGRKDFQVKIQGHRIELDEIDFRISAIDGILNSVTAARMDESSGTLISFYQAETDMDEDKIRAELSDKLPDYMIPADFVRVKEIIRNANGKTDRKAMLEEYERSVADNNNRIKVEDPTLNILIELMKKENISVPSDISFETGMESLAINSVKYVAVVVAIELEFDIEFDDDYLSVDAFNTVGDLVKYITDKCND